MIDYEKLTMDLVKAKESAILAVKEEDGGSANLDCVTINLPRYNEEKVIEAVKKAGLYTRGKRKWIGIRYFISSPIGAQGNDRTRQVKAMYEVLKDMGYDVLIYYQMD